MLAPQAPQDRTKLRDGRIWRCSCAPTIPLAGALQASAANTRFAPPEFPKQRDLSSAASARGEDGDNPQQPQRAWLRDHKAVAKTAFQVIRRRRRAQEINVGG